MHDKVTRKDIVLAAANQDGGAHVDAQPDKKTVNLMRGFWTITKNVDGKVVKQRLNNEHFPLLRQLAHEVLNSPDICDSIGKKIDHKLNRGILIPMSPDAFPEEIKQQLAKKEAEGVAFEIAHGKGNSIVTTEFNDLRFVAVGNELHHLPKDRIKLFPDFLGYYLIRLMGEDWWKAELAKPLEARHSILKWYDTMCSYQRTLMPDADGIYRSANNGAMLSWYRLAYDLYLIRHNATLQKRILSRLRHKDNFQGARFELCVTASMIAAGFEINYEDEADRTQKHVEFIATHPSGLRIAVEAKSRHRDGILNFKASFSRAAKNKGARVRVGGILREAIEKAPAGPYIIFVDVNLHPSEEHLNGKPWFNKMAGTMEKLKAEWQPGSFPVNAIFFCNDPTYHIPHEIPEGAFFWCYRVLIKDAYYPLPNQELTMHIAQAMLQRINIPNEFPAEDR